MEHPEHQLHSESTGMLIVINYFMSTYYSIRHFTSSEGVFDLVLLFWLARVNDLVWVFFPPEEKKPLDIYSRVHIFLGGYYDQ